MSDHNWHGISSDGALATDREAGDVFASILERQPQRPDSQAERDKFGDRHHKAAEPKREDAMYKAKAGLSSHEQKDAFDSLLQGSKPLDDPPTRPAAAEAPAEDAQDGADDSAIDDGPADSSALATNFVEDIARAHKERWANVDIAAIRAQHGPAAAQQVIAQQQAEELETHRLVAHRAQSNNEFLQSLAAEGFDTSDGAAIAKLDRRMTQAAQALGYGREQLARASAKDLRALYKLVQLQSSNASERQAPERVAAAKPAPKSAVGRARARLERSGRVEDAAGVFRKMLG
jgi:hypothetical protein